jgi:hypothetical protein
MDIIDGSGAPASLEDDDFKTKEESETAFVEKENGYLTVLKNVPFLMFMLENL